MYIVSRREKRTKLEIFYDIITAIEKESYNQEAKPTRVQQRCNMSYDKFSKYVQALTHLNLINYNSVLSITDKGRKFLKDYEKIKGFLTDMKLEYTTKLEEDPIER